MIIRFLIRILKLVLVKLVTYTQYIYIYTVSTYTHSSDGNLLRCMIGGRTTCTAGYVQFKKLGESKFMQK